MGAVEVRGADEDWNAVFAKPGIVAQGLGRPAVGAAADGDVRGRGALGHVVEADVVGDGAEVEILIGRAARRRRGRVRIDVEPLGRGRAGSEQQGGQKRGKEREPELVHGWDSRESGSNSPATATSAREGWMCMGAVYDKMRGLDRQGIELRRARWQQKRGDSRASRGNNEGANRRAATGPWMHGPARAREQADGDACGNIILDRGRGNRNVG